MCEGSERSMEEGNGGLEGIGLKVARFSDVEPMRLNLGMPLRPKQSRVKSKRCTSEDVGLELCGTCLLV